MYGGNVLQGNDLYPIILDGLVVDPSPGQLWVGRDSAALTDRLELLAVAIVTGKAPKELLGKRLLSSDASDLIRMLHDGQGSPAARLDAWLRELAGADVAFALYNPQLLLSHTKDVDVLDSICDALARHWFVWFAGLTDPAGLSALRARKPRLVAALATYDHDAGTVTGTGRFIVPTADPDRGWTVVVRCQLTAPVPALDQVAAGSMVAVPGGVGVLEDPAVEKIMLVRSDEGHPGMLVALHENAVAADEAEKAEEIALAAARRLIWRSLKDDERIEATRAICLIDIVGHVAG